MLPASINLGDKLALFSETWTPKVIAELNDYQLKVVKLEGEFVWHTHDDTDELFVCLEGSFEIEFHDGTVTVQQGELCVVPKGLAHKPMAKEVCHVLIIEPSGVVNTGEADSALTAPNDEWI